jgi:tetratricopeptide (TPR) repeat protein
MYAAIVAAAYTRAVLGRMAGGEKDEVEPLKSARGTPNNLRARNPYFRGRGEELAALEDVLGRDRKATITHASVFGLGGVGKTALALELAHRGVDAGVYPGGVWWVAAEGNPIDALVGFAPVLRAIAPADVQTRLPKEETRAEVIAEQVRLALQGNLLPRIHMEVIAEQVRLALQGQKAASLLVLDNVSEQWGKHIPGGAVRVLVTTLDEGFAIGVTRRLEVLSREQAREVAEAIAGEPRDEAEAEARDRVLVTELGGLVVAVEMAARAAKRWFSGSWTAYERVLRTEMEKVLEDPKLYGDYGRGVFAALDLSIDRCDAEARVVLEGAAVLAPEAVPLTWVLRAAEVEVEGLAAVRAMATLKELGLVTVDEDKQAVSMHRLVHRRVRARAEAEHKDLWDTVAGWEVVYVLKWILGAVDLNQTRTQMEVVDARREHIDQALGMAERFGNEMAWIGIANKLATHLQNHARYDESSVLFQQTLARAEKLTPSDPSVVAVCLCNLGFLHQDLGQPAAARPLLERALAVYGPDHPAAADVLSNLARGCLMLGEPAAARQFIERAVTIDEAIYGPNHRRVAVRLSILAKVHEQLGQPAVALPLLKRALDINESTYGPNHPAVAADLSILATVHKALGEPTSACPLFERALVIAETTYGPSHPFVAILLTNLASVHQDLGEPTAARPLLERAVAIAEAHLPPDHPHQALFRNNLAALDPPR